MLCTEREGVIRRTRLMTHGIWAEFWLIKSSCWCCAWLPTAFFAMGSLKWLPELLKTNQALGARPRCPGAIQGRWILPSEGEGQGRRVMSAAQGSLAALLAVHSMSQHRATAARAQSQEEWVSWALSAPLRNLSLEAQQEQKSCLAETSSHPPGYIITRPAVSQGH